MTAIDRDPGRLADARHNARIYGVEGRIRFVAGDVLELLPSLNADVLFVDPPWGVDWNRAGMGLVEFPMLHALLRTPVVRQFRRVILKLPPSFRVGEIVGGKPEAVYGVGAGDIRRVKFVWVMLGS